MYKIKSIKVTNLFGYHGNNCTIDLLTDRLVTFVYAFNGAGKTTVMRLVEAALKTKLIILDSIVFKELTIMFDNNEFLIVKKYLEKKFDEAVIAELPKEDNGKYFFPITYQWISEKCKYPESKFYMNEKLSNIFNSLQKEDLQLHFFSNINNKSQEFLANFYRKSEILFESFMSSRETENFICKLGNKIDILFANRDYNRLAYEQLIRAKKDNGAYSVNIFDNYETSDTISFNMKEVEENLRKRKAEINSMNDIAFSQEFVYRNDSYDNEEKNVLFTIPDKINYLINEFKMLVTNSGLMRFSLQDNYSPEEYREKQFELYENIINDSIKLYEKEFKINRISGAIEIKTKYIKNGFLNPKYLSSGEKNLLLLYFYLIFYKRNDGIYLIDEPEVSMHPDWLISFVENLKKIAGDCNMQYIFATHSPAITYGHSDLMVEMRR